MFPKVKLRRPGTAMEVRARAYTFQVNANDKRCSKAGSAPSKLSSIPTGLVPVKTGKDSKPYYDLHFQIRITLYSASTKYELWFKDTCYGMVSTDYA